MKKPVRAKLDAGQRADRAAKQLMEKRGLTYQNALAAVFKKEPALFKEWRRAPKADPLRQLTRLANFLNGNDKDAIKLRSEIAPVIDYETAPPDEVRRAADRLAKQISRVDWVADCIKVRSRRKELLRPVFYIMSAGWYGDIANAIRAGTLHRLKRCQWEDCRRFFATLDHRVNYCPDRDCFSKHEAFRVKLWRAKEK